MFILSIDTLIQGKKVNGELVYPSFVEKYRYLYNLSVTSFIGYIIAMSVNLMKTHSIH